jgi:hypothetical protein
MPIILSTLADQMAVNPSGKPVAAPIPVAPVVLKAISEGKGKLIQSDGVADALVTVLPNTVIVPVALTVPHPPVNGIA